jgi:Uncharacterized ABC-type transport system, periplasmic component/surface lipoprotein
MKFSMLSKAIAGGVAMSALMAGAALADAALLYDGGGQFDKSFNEAAYNGAEVFASEGGAYQDLDISGQGDAMREQALRQFASRGFSPIITPGFSWETALRTVAPEFPDSQFTIIDAVVDLPNVQSVVFKEHEGSYLVGVLAAMKSESGKVGVIPAFNFDLLESFACGYAQGAKSVNPDIQVLQTYVGTGFDAFNDPVKAAEVAKSQLDQGADVIFQVAGGAGAGVLQAAADAGKYGIGVDSNQNFLHPGSVLTSMLKRVDLVTYNAMKAGAEGTWAPGITTLGVAEEGVGAAFDEFNADIVTDEMKAAVEKATADIISGAVVVHDFRTDKTCPA